MLTDLHTAAAQLRSAADALDAVQSRGTYTIAELREIRSLVLRTVREEIDPYACGRMPEKRHY